MSVTTRARNVPPRPAELGFYWRKVWHSNPRWPCDHNGFRDRPIRPLWQPSVRAMLAAPRTSPSQRCVAPGPGRSENDGVDVGFAARLVEHVERAVVDDHPAGRADHGAAQRRPAQVVDP